MTNILYHFAHLTFHEIQFDIVDRNNKPWLRLPQIGAALEYTNPYKIQQLYERNADEFTDSMTAIINLPSAGGNQNTRIFSLRGTHLIAMLARTPVAKEFRRWVLDVLDKEVKPPPPLIKPKPKPKDDSRVTIFQFENCPIEAFNAAAKTLKCLQIANWAVYVEENSHQWVRSA